MENENNMSIGSALYKIFAAILILIGYFSPFIIIMILFSLPTPKSDREKEERIHKHEIMMKREQIKHDSIKLEILKRQQNE